MQQQRRSGKKERQDETQFITKIDGFFFRKDRMKLSLSQKLMVFFQERQDETQPSDDILHFVT